MTPQTKKKVIVIGSLLVVGGIGYYLWDKHKKEALLSGGTPDDKTSETPPLTPDTAPKDGTPTGEKNHIVLKTKYPVIKSKTASTPKPSGDGSLVSANDLLAGGLNLGNGKQLVAGYNNLQVYNLHNSPSFKAKKGTVLGTIINAEKTSDGKSIWLVFKGSNGVGYKVVSSGNLIKN